MITMNEPIKPGTDNQEPGEYIEVGPQGEQFANAREVTIEAGDRLPPTSKSGNGWIKKDNSSNLN